MARVWEDALTSSWRFARVWETLAICNNCGTLARKAFTTAMWAIGHMVIMILVAILTQGILPWTTCPIGLAGDDMITIDMIHMTMITYMVSMALVAILPQGCRPSSAVVICPTGSVMIII